MIKKWTLGGLIFLVLVGMTSMVSADEKKMTREEYQAQLADYTQREETGKQEIADLDAQIASLQRQIKALDAEFSSIESETQRLVEASEGEIRTYDNQVDALIDQLEGLMALSPEDLFQRRSELQDIADQLAELKASKIAALPEVAEKIGRLEELLANLEGRRPRQMTVTYQIQRGDNLWNISKKEDIYADPYMWPRIYRANRDQISDPDLIYPEKVLNIPFGVSENQYLVTSGDFLYKIAAAVYNDPTKWHKILKANEAQIVEKDLVFPAQVLEIPAN